MSKCRDALGGRDSKGAAGGSKDSKGTTGSAKESKGATSSAKESKGATSSAKESKGATSSAKEAKGTAAHSKDIAKASSEASTHVGKNDITGKVDLTLGDHKVSVDKIIADALTRACEAPAKPDSSSFSGPTGHMEHNANVSGLKEYLGQNDTKSSVDFCSPPEPQANGGYKFAAIPDASVLSQKDQAIAKESSDIAAQHQISVKNNLNQFASWNGTTITPGAKTVALVEIASGVTPQAALAEFDRIVSLGIGNNLAKEMLAVATGKFAGTFFAEPEAIAGVKMLSDRLFNSVDMVSAGLKNNTAAAGWSGAKSTMGTFALAVPGAKAVEVAMAAGPIAADVAHAMEAHTALNNTDTLDNSFSPSAGPAVREAFDIYGGGDPGFESLVTPEGLFYLGEGCPWSAH